MEPKLLKSRVVFVKDPTALPQNVQHHEAVEALARSNNLVVLMSHGNPYLFPEGWIMPYNVKTIDYDLTVEGITAGVVQARDLLRTYNIDLHSRHLDNDEALPMLLAGACLTVPVATEVAFINKPSQFKTDAATTTSEEHFETIWDLSD